MVDKTQHNDMIQAEQSGCEGCEETCQLITNNCLCQLTSLKWMDLHEYTDLIDKANAYLEGITGKCDLCEDFGTSDYCFTELIESKAFKRLYANLIEYYWLCEYGHGQNRKAGFTVPRSDDFSGFEIRKPNLSKKWATIEGYKNRFLDLIKKEHAKCFECKPQLCNKCQCEVKKCQCHQYSISDTVAI